MMRDEARIRAELDALASSPDWDSPGADPVGDIQHFMRAAHAGATWADVYGSMKAGEAGEALRRQAAQGDYIVLPPYGTWAEPIGRWRRIRRWLSVRTHRRHMWALL